jgi:hypothetical protein
MNQRIHSRTVRRYVQAKKQFVASNLFGEWASPRIYVVYSYGKHWPLFAYEPTQDAWYENDDNHSKTTSRHRSVSHPQCNTDLLSLTELQDLIKFYTRPSTDATTKNVKSVSTASAGASATLAN